MRMKAMIIVLAASFGCGGPQKNRVPADTELLPYIAPDVDELSGTATDEDEDEPTEPAPAQNPQK
ncbi:MAG: hypothetical protein SFX73_40465 [Kofleriaceae bacterium]|nr:hypothetical protein [Kofleriaceae bacterium]